MDEASTTPILAAQKSPARAQAEPWPGALWVEAVHTKMYPEDTSYYWYRSSRWGKDVGGRVTLTAKYGHAIALGVFCAVLGAGQAPFVAWYVLHLAGLVGGFSHLPIDQLWFCIPVCLCCGLFTAGTYYWNAMRLESAYNVLQAARPEDWKVQPEKKLSPKLHREAVVTALFNSCLAAILGTAIFLRHLNTGTTLTMYLDIDHEHGYLHFVWSVILVFVWIDVWAYCAHRFLHMKAIYKYFHKWHHRYQPPTAITAFAMHPCEFMLFQMGGISCCFLFEIHIVAFMFNAVLVAYHGQVDHSGIDFEGDLPWQPSVHFHDDHHKYFHLNFGQNLILWDYLFGTLRQSDRKYGEEVFVGTTTNPASGGTLSSIVKQEAATEPSSAATHGDGKMLHRACFAQVPE